MVKKMKLLVSQQPEVALKFTQSQEHYNSQHSEEGNLELTICQLPENYSPWSSASKLVPSSSPQKETETPVSLRKSLFSSSKYSSSGSESAEILQIQTREEQDREILKMQQVLDLLDGLQSCQTIDLPEHIDKLAQFSDQLTPYLKTIYDKCIVKARQKAWNDYRALDHLRKIIPDPLIEEQMQKLLQEQIQNRKRLKNQKQKNRGKDFNKPLEL